MEQRQVFSLLESLSKTRVSVLPRYLMSLQDGFVSRTALSTQAWQAVREAAAEERDMREGVVPAETVMERTARRAEAVMVRKYIFCACVCS